MSNGPLSDDELEQLERRMTLPGAWFHPLVLRAIAEIRASRATRKPPKPGANDPCARCGHRCYEHIYGEGPCRPGFVCECPAFVPG